MAKRKLLGERLVEKGLITQAQLNEALRVQARTGELLGDVLVKMGILSQEDLDQVLEEEERAPRRSVDPEVLKLIPEHFIRKYKVFPVRREGDRLYVATADPLNVVALDDVRLVSGCRIEPVKATEREIAALIEKYLGPPEVERALQEIGEEGRGEEEEAEVLLDEAPVIRLVNSLITRAIEEEASDIHIEPFSKGVRVRYRVDGILREATTLPRQMRAAVVARIKVMAGMDIAERRLPQDGRIPLRFQERAYDLRVSTLPTLFGEKVEIRILDKEGAKKFTPETLGFSPRNYELFTGFLRSAAGMLLVTGPTGSGKTTTLYAALNVLNTVEKNIVTVEDPVEYVLEGVNQCQVNTKAGATFATYLRSLLRQDPDVIMVGEIRDRETAEIAVRAATTGHLVLSTLHTDDAPGALTRLLDMGVEPFMVASAVLGVVAQRLARRVCERCRRPARPGAAEVAFAGGLAPDAILYEGAGCPECGYTGYRGRLALQEVLAVTPEIQRLVLRRAAAAEIREAALAAGMVPLKEDGVQKALQGLTTLREVMRVSYREGN